jgi:hypothetical protein
MREERMAIVNRKVCGTWPDCGCYGTLELWGRYLQDDERFWKLEELEIGEQTIYINLACVSHYCPDPVVREYARQQLKKRFWDRQRAMDIHMEQ